jgi:phospholipid/cholesterol/gamma-HCH transport system substrate-binding protein
VEDNRETLRLTVETIEDLSGRLNEEVPALLVDIRELSDQLKTILEENQGDISESMTATKQLLQKLEDSATTLQSILDKINQGDGSVGKLLNDPETVENVNDLMDRTANVLVDVENLLQSPPSIRFNYAFRAEYYNKSEDLKYYYRLVTKFNEYDHLYVDVVNDQIYNKPPLFTQGDDLDDNQALDFLGDDFSFSAQYGRKIPGGMVRIGIIENETGLAFDVGNFFDDRMSFTIEGYDFGRNDGPHLKALTNIQLWDGVHLTIGYDDPLSETTNQWFYGGGIRF